MAVQWLGLHGFTAEGTGSIPGLGTKIPQAVQGSQKKKREKEGELGLEPRQPSSVEGLVQLSSSRPCSPDIQGRSSRPWPATMQATQHIEEEQVAALFAPRVSASWLCSRPLGPAVEDAQGAEPNQLTGCSSALLEDPWSGLQIHLPWEPGQEPG